MSDVELLILESFVAELKAIISSMEYRVNSPRKRFSLEELKEQVNWILHKVIPDSIDEYLLRKKENPDV